MTISNPADVPTPYQPPTPEQLRSCLTEGSNELQEVILNELKFSQIQPDARGVRITPPAVTDRDFIVVLGRDAGPGRPGFVDGTIMYVGPPKEFPGLNNIGNTPRSSILYEPQSGRSYTDFPVTFLGWRSVGSGGYNPGILPKDGSIVYLRPEENSIESFRNGMRTFGDIVRRVYFRQ